jgi:hypothetical protein
VQAWADDFISGYASVTGNECHKQIVINPYAQTAGNNSLGLYPFEFRLPSLKPFHCKVHIPPGYTADTIAAIQSNFLGIRSKPRNFIVYPNAMQDSIDVDLSSVYNTYPVYCLTDTVPYTDTTSLNLYSGDNKLSLTIIIDLKSTGCNPDSFYIANDSDIVSEFKDNLTSCFDSIPLY